MLNASDSEAGFSLAEVLVAFAILSVVTILSLSGAAQAIRNLDHAGRSAFMLQTAQSLVARAAAAPRIKVGEVKGRTSNGFHWQYTITPLPEGPRPAWTRARAFAIEARIAESESLEDPLVLSTIIVAAPQP